MTKTKEKRKQKTVTLYESQIELVQKFANVYYDEDFSQGLRKIIRLWNESNRFKTTADQTEP